MSRVAAQLLYAAVYKKRPFRAFLCYNEPMKINFQKISYALLIINIIFWLFIAGYFAFFKFPSQSIYLILKILLFIEPACFAVILIGVIKKIKPIYYFGLMFLVINALLSLTDEVGIWDITSFLLNISLFLTLLPARNQYKK